MKTGGTSLRSMLISQMGECAVYPNDQELAAQPHGWYPESDFISKNLGTIRKHQVLVGHHPFSLLHQLGQSYQAVTFLREPFSRTFSMLAHRRRTVKGCGELSDEALLADERFVGEQILNYQTKVFADGVKRVNGFHLITEADLKTAVQNLNSFALVGISEHFHESCLLFDRIFQTRLAGGIRHENANPEPRPMSPDLREKIRPLIQLDLVLYEEAMKKFRRDLAGQGIVLPLQHR